ncbi:hypothetical protein [Cystobacter fuscus]|uniref:hypothetical protein n=1 Tax=Cystobacter fuscus TaxID=43 RepID=UPI002B316D10|nr:hypothetical protein F0U63_46640 [Cystobacter fuscus]
MKNFKCAQCGRGQVKPVAKPGRRAAFKNIPDLELPATLEIPTCEACGAEWLDEESTHTLDAALAEAYRRELSKRANSALRKLKAAKLRQWDLEPLLGLSAGYLSKIKTGKDVSPILTAALILLAEAPERVEELRNAWRCVAPAEVKTSACSQVHVELSEHSWSWTSHTHLQLFLSVPNTNEAPAQTTHLTLDSKLEYAPIPASFLEAAA